MYCILMYIFYCIALSYSTLYYRSMLCTAPHHRTLHSIIVQSDTWQKSCKSSVAPPGKNRRSHQRYEFALAVHHISSSDKHYTTVA